MIVIVVGIFVYISIILLSRNVRKMLDSVTEYRIFLAFNILYDFLLFYIYYKIIPQSTLRYHGAEHMVINAWQELGKVPNLDEIKEFSRFNDACGTNIFTLLLGYQFFKFVSTFLMYTNTVFFMVISVIYLICLKKCGKLNFMQNFSTAEPTDKELKIAISALQCWVNDE